MPFPFRWIDWSDDAGRVTLLVVTIGVAPSPQARPVHVELLPNTRRLDLCRPWSRQPRWASRTHMPLAVP